MRRLNELFFSKDLTLQKVKSARPSALTERIQRLYNSSAEVSEQSVNGTANTYNYVHMGRDNYPFKVLSSGELLGKSIIKYSMGDRESLTIADIGAAVPLFLKEFEPQSNFFGVSVSAFDMRSSELPPAPNHHYLVGNAEYLDELLDAKFPKNLQFDYIISAVTLLHLQDKLGFVVLAYARLKEGGMLILDEITLKGVESAEAIINYLKAQGHKVYARCKGNTILTMLLIKTDNKLIFPVEYNADLQNSKESSIYIPNKALKKYTTSNDKNLKIAHSKALEKIKRDWQQIPSRITGQLESMSFDDLTNLLRSDKFPTIDDKYEVPVKKIAILTYLINQFLSTTDTYNTSIAIITENKKLRSIYYSCLSNETDSLFSFLTHVLSSSLNNDEYKALMVAIVVQKTHDLAKDIYLRDDLISLLDLNYDKALISGDNAIVKFLLDIEVSPNHTDANGNTPVHKAIIRQNWEAVKIFLNSPLVNIAMGNQQGLSIMHLLIASQNKELIMQALSMPDIVMHKGSTYKTLETTFLSSNKLSIKDKNGNNCLLFACSENLDDIAVLMVKEIGDVNICNNSGETALHIAVTNHLLNTINLLLDESTLDFTAKNKQRCTALHIACQNASYEIIRLFIKKIPTTTLADSFLIKDGSGKTSVDYLNQKKPPKDIQQEIGNLLSAPQVILQMPKNDDNTMARLSTHDNEEIKTVSNIL